jgi:alpha-beta hydrolase superfamily lysophospholipase
MAIDSSDPPDLIDRPEIAAYLFHPRPEWSFSDAPDTAEPVTVPLSDGESLGGWFHPVDRRAPTLLFFHGNGEIAADYHDIAPAYTQRGIQFFPVDYRGYGRSSGRPSVSATLRDAHETLDFLLKRRAENGESGPVAVMGRSLGSAPAIELAATRAGEVDGIVVESGFAHTGPLLEILGLDTGIVGFDETRDGIGNLEKIGNYRGPLLIVHAEGDHLIPFSDGRELHDACPSDAKRLVPIPGADHNTLMVIGFAAYMGAVETFIRNLKRER